MYEMHGWLLVTQFVVYVFILKKEMVALCWPLNEKNSSEKMQLQYKLKTIRITDAIISEIICSSFIKTKKTTAK